MYKKHFGLRENPFNVNPDPRFLYPTAQTRKVLTQLKYGIGAGKGLFVLTGEVGTGKTTLINCLLSWLRQRGTPTAFVSNYHMSTNHFREFILGDFKIPYDPGLKGNLLLPLNRWLLERHRAGETPVLIVDEAQGLSRELLAEVGLLLNMETPSTKLLQIVLSGQPELEGKLRRPELRQLGQRIALRCKTAPLTCEETRAYIHERLRIAGAADQTIFESAAMDAAFRYSDGIARVLNQLCDQALVNAYVNNISRVPARCVEEAAREFVLNPYPCDAPAPAVSTGLLPQPLAPALEAIPPAVSAAATPAEEGTSERVPAPTKARLMEQFIQQRQNPAPPSSAPLAVAAESPKSIVPVPHETPVMLSPPAARSASTVPARSPGRIRASRSFSMRMAEWNRAVDIWWADKFSRQLRWRSFVLAGLGGTILLLLSQQISVSQPGSRLARTVCAFLALLFWSASLFCAASLLLHSPRTQRQIAARCSKLFASFHH